MRLFRLFNKPCQAAPAADRVRVVLLPRPFVVALRLLSCIVLADLAQATEETTDFDLARAVIEADGGGYLPAMASPDEHGIRYGRLDGFRFTLDGLLLAGPRFEAAVGLHGEAAGECLHWLQLSDGSGVGIARRGPWQEGLSGQAGSGRVVVDSRRCRIASVNVRGLLTPRAVDAILVGVEASRLRYRLLMRDIGAFTGHLRDDDGGWTPVDGTATDLEALLTLAWDGRHTSDPRIEDLTLVGSADARVVLAIARPGYRLRAQATRFAFRFDPGDGRLRALEPGAFYQGRVLPPTAR